MDKKERPTYDNKNRDRYMRMVVYELLKDMSEGGSVSVRVREEGLGI